MINITLLIQALNFLIAYMILAHFFFKPVLKVMQKRANQELGLNHLVTSYHHTIKDSNAKKRQIWATAQAEFSKYNQFCNMIGIKAKACDQGLTSEALDFKTDIQTTQDLAKILVDKIVAMK